MTMGLGPGKGRVPAAPPATLCNSWSTFQDRSHAPGAAGQELPFGQVVCPQQHLTSARTRVLQKSLAVLPRHTQGTPPKPSPASEPQGAGLPPAVLPHGCSKSCICLWTSEASL